MPKVLRILAVLFAAAAGCLFILSSLAKLFPVETFELSFVEAGVAGWRSAPLVARLVIGLEMTCGLLLLSGIAIRRLALPLCCTLLTIFSAYLIYQLYKYGNTGNCGCFGQYLAMTPGQALIKNIILLSMCAGIYAWHPRWKLPYSQFMIMGAFLLALTMPFILNPPDFTLAEQQYGNLKNYQIELGQLYSDKTHAPKAELRQGKWIIAFMSLRCSHCRTAARKLHVMKMKKPDLPLHMVLNGDSAYLKPFFEDTRAGNVSWNYYPDIMKFIRMSGPSLPGIYWVDNSTVAHKSNYRKLMPDEVDLWLEKGELPSGEIDIQE